MKKRYILTDSCYWHGSKNKRSPHFIEVVDLKTGQVIHIESGSVIEVIRATKIKPA